MPSGWGVYYVVFLSAALALAIPVLLGLLGRVFSPRGIEKRDPGEAFLERGPAPSPSAKPFFPGKRVNVRFFLATNAALVLIALMLIVVPGVGALRGDHSTRRDVLRTLFSVISVAGFASVGLLYSARKGDLSWLTSFQAEHLPPPGSTRSPSQES